MRDIPPDNKLGVLTRLIAQLLTDPSYAKRITSDSSHPAWSDGLDSRLAGRLRSIPASEWRRRAEAIKVVPHRFRAQPAMPPDPGDLPFAPLMPGGRPLVAGIKHRIEIGHRTVSFRRTIRRAQRVLRTVGVTRVSQTTGVDRLGIPVWSSIRPASPVISVFNGKGDTDDQAKAGALMEAIERHAAEFRPPDSRVATFAAIARDGAALHPVAAKLVAADTFDPRRKFEWTRSWDLLNGESVWVPTSRVMLPYIPLPGVKRQPSDSNGLASGNSLEEAICHGLAELIERDAHTLVAVGSYLGPIARALARGVVANPPRRRHRVMSDVPEHLDLATVPPAERRIVERFKAAEVELCVLDITSDLGIPTFWAHALDRHLQGQLPQACCGMGTHPTAAVALRRALTEAAQSRVTAIQGAREDIGELFHQSDFHPLFPVARQGTRHWRNVPSRPTTTVRDDILIMLAALRRARIPRCLVKDLTRRDVGIPVAMVIVPEMETWASSAAHGVPAGIGPRALAVL